MLHSDKDLVTAISEMRDENSWEPLTIICPASGRDDVVTHLAAAGGSVGITVQTPTMFLRSQHTKFTPRTYLNHGEILRRVAAILREGGTPFNSAGIAEQPETLISLAGIVQRLLALSPEDIAKHSDKKLPQSAAELATAIREETKDEFFTEYDIRQAAKEEIAGGKVLCVGLLFADPKLEDVFAGAPGASLRNTTPTQVLNSYVDEEEELLAVARTIRKLVSEKNVPLHRIAVGCANPSYIAKGTRILTEAGIPVVSPVGRSVADTPTGKAFLKLLSIDPAVMPRREITAAIETGALKDAVSLWDFDCETREKSGMFNLADWKHAVQAYPDNEVFIWIDGLVKEVTNLWSNTSWSAVAEALTELATNRLNHNPEQELILAAIAELRKMDAVRGLAPSQDLVAQLLLQDLSSATFESKAGIVVLGELDTLYGRDLHTAFLVGISNDVFPGSFQVDAAVTPEQSGKTSEHYAHYTDELWKGIQRCADYLDASYARTSLIAPTWRDHTPWLPLEEEGDIKDESSEDTEEKKGPAFTPSPGLIAYLQSESPEPVNQEELDLITALAHPGADSTYGAIAKSRKEAIFDEYNGNIDSPIGARYFDKSISASALESFATSPLLFFIDRVLAQKVLSDEDEINEVDSRDRGTLYHAIFEQWVKEIWLQPDSPRSYDGVDWDHAKTRLYEIAEAESRAIQTGRYSETTKMVQLAEIDKILPRWFEQQQEDAKQGWIPIGAEASFGFDDEQPLEVILPDGNVIKFWGKIDRIDINVSGPEKKIRVTDYKSGKAKRYQKDLDGPSSFGLVDDKGTLALHIQLGLYGEAIRQAIAGKLDTMIPSLAEWGVDEETKIHARYSFFRDKDSEGAAIVGLDVGEAEIEEFYGVLLNIRNAIVDGRFPAHVISETWDDERRFRMGSKGYDGLASAFKEQGIAPLAILETQKEEAE